jgi:hypothetical protein
MVEAVEELSRTLTIALGHSDVMFAHGYPDINALRTMRASLEAAISTTLALREQILSGAIGGTDALRGTVLRERAAAVVMQVAELRLAETEVAIYGRELFTGRFRSLLDVTLFILNRITQVNDRRLSAQLAAEEYVGNDVLTLSARREQYAFAIDQAEHDFAAIGTDPDLLRFLEGGAWVPSEPFRIACRVIAMLFDVQLTRQRGDHIAAALKA